MDQLGPFQPTIPWQAGAEYLQVRGTGGIPPSEDAAEVYLDLSVFVTEEVPVVYFDLRVISVEAAQFVDSATVYLDLRQTGGECFSSSSALNLDAEARLRWFGNTSVRWEAEESARWFVSSNFSQFVCTEDDVSLRWQVIGLSTEQQGC